MPEFNTLAPVTIATSAAPVPAGPYSQAVAADGLVLCSGQMSIDPASGRFVGRGDVTVQAAQILTNLDAILAAAGTSMSEVVKTTIFLTEMESFPIVNEVYSSFFPGILPARSCIAVVALPIADALVEIEAVAHVSPQQ
ncbi:Rid family detoxifying hydrolase [Saccharopolyspora sp. 5N102]|uniref:Rid family detoxifying hydrolase n=1 Tax=Saccharopolyspora sp. 5N102 TaxID=3375155 RepID=UPI0037B3CC90